MIRAQPRLGQLSIVDNQKPVPLDRGARWHSGKERSSTYAAQNITSVMPTQGTPFPHLCDAREHVSFCEHIEPAELQIRPEARSAGHSRGGR
jgi:hypothetical protein